MRQKFCQKQVVMAAQWSRQRCAERSILPCRGPRISFHGLFAAGGAPGSEQVRAPSIGRGNSGVGMRRVIVLIDRLVLKGFRHEDGHGTAQGLRQELGRVFSGQGAAQHLSTLGDISRMRVGGVDINPRSKPQRVGVEVAQVSARR